jgi:hypothetical protein
VLLADVDAVSSFAGIICLADRRKKLVRKADRSLSLKWPSVMLMVEARVPAIPYSFGGHLSTSGEIENEQVIQSKEVASRLGT